MTDKRIEEAESLIRGLKAVRDVGESSFLDGVEIPADTSDADLKATVYKYLGIVLHSYKARLARFIQADEAADLTRARGVLIERATSQQRFDKKFKEPAKPAADLMLMLKANLPNEYNLVKNSADGARQLAIIEKLLGDEFFRH